MRNIVLAAAAAGLLPGSAAAQAQAPAHPGAPAAPAKDDRKRLVCKAQEQIGTRLGARKVCLTAEEWAEKHREHREFTDDIQSGAWAQDSIDQMRDSRMGQTPQ